MQWDCPGNSAYRHDIISTVLGSVVNRDSDDGDSDTDSVEYFMLVGDGDAQMDGRMAKRVGQSIATHSSRSRSNIAVAIGGTW